MKQTTLCFLIEGNPPKKILLGLKKRGFGKNKLNGFGGKVQENESIEEAVLRELEEETGIKAQLKGISKVGELTFIFPPLEKEHEWNQTVHIFFVFKWQGHPIKSEEMQPFWMNVQELPFEKMWQDDKYWLPKVLNNKFVKGKFIFNEDNESFKEFELNEFNL